MFYRCDMHSKHSNLKEIRDCNKRRKTKDKEREKACGRRAAVEPVNDRETTLQGLMHEHLVKECHARGPGFTFSITLPSGSYDAIKVTALREFLTCPVGEQLMQYPAIQAPPTAQGLFLDDGSGDAEELEASASAGVIVPELAEQAARRRVWFRVMSVKKCRIMHGGPGVVNLAPRELNGQMEMNDSKFDNYMA